MKEQGPNSPQQHNNTEHPYEPKRFIVFIGGYMGSSFGVRWSKRILYYEYFEMEYRLCKIEEYHPTESDWNNFWEAMDKIKAWNWRKKYQRPACDGTNWHINIHHQGKKLKSSGDNAYPPNGAIDPGRYFNTFCKTIRQLIGGSDFY